MKKSRQEIHRNIFYWLCLTFVFVLPIHGRLVPPVIFLMVLNWLIDGSYIRNFSKMFREKQRIRMLAFGFIYILYLVGMLYSKNMDYGLFDLEVKLSLIIFPLLFASSEKDGFSENEMRFLFRTYIAGCFTGVMILLVHALVNQFYYKIPQAIYYLNLSWSFQPSYFAMYLVFAISVIGGILVKGYTDISYVQRGVYLFLLLLFFIQIILLSSKAGIFTLVIILLLIIGYIVGKMKKPFIAVLILFIFSGLFYTGIRIFPFAAERINRVEGVLKSNRDSMMRSTDGTAERLLIWRAAFDVILRHPLVGTGTGDIKDALFERYKSSNNVIAFEKKLNAHNQYLQTFGTLGILGLLLLLAMLILPAQISIRKGNYLYFLFLLIFASNILVESMLESQAGVVFYAFFNALLFWSINTEYQ